ncbi:MAG TPA: ABC transporter substrate-binding protein [Candidatus Limnocylindria bacterium]|nr:ABC transporter substrate-binding protein [Candidatus Limnocylindria bacterium]
MRAPLIALALLFAACTSVPTVTEPTPRPTREPNTVSVSVLLDLSGSRAPSGQPQRNAMQLWLDRAQAAQPRSAVKLRVKFVDVAGSDAKLLLELRRAAVDDGADAVVVGVPIALDDTFARAVELASVPVLLTLPAPEPAGAVGGRWTFALAPTPRNIAHALVDDLAARDLLPPTVLAGDETAPAITERAAFAAEIGARGRVAPTPVILTQPDGPQRAKAAVAGARSVVLSGASEKYAELVRGIPSALEAPRVYLSYLTETADITNLRDQSALVTWPGSRNLATLSVTPFWPERAAFVRAFSDRHGAPSTLAATAYDALAILSAAAEQAPSELEGPRLRLRLETLTFVGVVTRYSFTFTRHAGFAPDDLTYLRWNGRAGAPFLATEPKENPR